MAQNAASGARQVDIAYEITFAGLSGFRIDLTATQFWRTPKVYVTPVGDLRYGAPFARDEAVWQMATGADVARERLLRAYDAYLTLERKNRRD